MGIGKWEMEYLILQILQIYEFYKLKNYGRF